MITLKKSTFGPLMPIIMNIYQPHSSPWHPNSPAKVLRWRRSPWIRNGRCVRSWARWARSCCFGWPRLAGGIGSEPSDWPQPSSPAAPWHAGSFSLSDGGTTTNINEPQATNLISWPVGRALWNPALELIKVQRHLDCCWLIRKNPTISDLIRCI